MGVGRRTAVVVSGHINVHVLGVRRSSAKFSSGRASSAPKSATTSSKRVDAPSHFSLDGPLQPVL